MPSPGSVSPLVLLHAFPLDGRMWQAQAASLSATCRVVAPDMRGFGENAASFAGLREISIDLAADDLAAALDVLGIQKAAVAGISRGAYVAMAFARRFPHRLTGLILLDSRATPADEAEQQNWEQMAVRLESEGIAFLPDAMLSRLLGPTAQREQPGLAAQVREIILSQQSVAVAAAARGMATRPDARPGLAAIRVPVLTIAGAEDAACGSTQAIAAAIPGARFVEIPSTGHLSALERPSSVTETIRAFLETL